MIMNIKQRKIKIEPRIKLKHNIYTKLPGNLYTNSVHFGSAQFRQQIKLKCFGLLIYIYL